MANTHNEYNEFGDEHEHLNRIFEKQICLKIHIHILLSGTCFRDENSILDT